MVVFTFHNAIIDQIRRFYEKDFGPIDYVFYFLS